MDQRCGNDRLYCAVTPNCPYWSRKLEHGPGVCALGFFDGQPYVGNCQACIGAGKNIQTPQIKAKPKELNKFFDRTVVINLDRRVDRMIQFNNMIMDLGWPFTPPERLRAVDSTLAPAPKKWRTQQGAWGCLRSHQLALEQALLDKIDCLLVMEDDVVFEEGYTKRLLDFLTNVPDDWDQLMIGGQLFNTSIKTPVKPGILKVVNCQRTHCYAVRGRFIRELYQRWSTADTHCDHVLGPFQKDYNVYAPTPFIAGQRKGASDIVAKDYDNVRFWNEPRTTTIAP